MALNVSSFDELNVLNDTQKAEPYDEYFGVMDITDEQKQKRIELAEKLEGNFLFVLALMFAMQKDGGIDRAVIQEEFEKAYMDGIEGAVDADSYMVEHMAAFAAFVTATSIDNADDIYFYSDDRAMFMAENESNNSYNHDEFIDALVAGKTTKTWHGVLDKRERKSHVAMEGKTVQIIEPFDVNGSLMLYPGDQDTYGADPKEIINCRCSVEYR